MVKITYDKILPGGDSEERSAVYTLKVIRAPYDKSNAYLADLAVIEEDEPNNGKYELDKNYNKLIRLYETVIDYTDIDGNQDKTKDLVKKVTVKISYMFKAKEQSVELSTVLSKES